MLAPLKVTGPHCFFYIPPDSQNQTTYLENSRARWQRQRIFSPCCACLRIGWRDPRGPQCWMGLSHAYPRALQNRSTPKIFIGEGSNAENSTTRADLKTNRPPGWTANSKGGEMHYARGSGDMAYSAHEGTECVEVWSTNNNVP